MMMKMMFLIMGMLMLEKTWTQIRMMDLDLLLFCEIFGRFHSIPTL